MGTNRLDGDQSPDRRAGGKGGAELNPQLRPLAQEQAAKRRQAKTDGKEPPVQLLDGAGLGRGGRLAPAGVDDAIGNVAIRIAIELEILTAASSRDALQRRSLEARFAWRCFC